MIWETIFQCMRALEPDWPFNDKGLTGELNYWGRKIGFQNFDKYYYLKQEAQEEWIEK